MKNENTEEKQKLIIKLQEILAKVSMGNATSTDIENAEEIGKQLGGIYLDLAAKIKIIALQQEEIKNHQNTLSTSYTDKEVLSSRAYFEDNESVRKSEDALRKIESGKSADSEEILQIWESLNSRGDRIKRIDFIEQLERKKSNIFKVVILEDRTELNDDERRRINEIDNEKLRFLKREEHDMVLTNSFGKYDSLLARQIVTKNKYQFEKCIRIVDTDFKKTEGIVAQETQLLQEHTRSIHAKKDYNDIKTKQYNISTVDTIMQKVKEEIKQLQEEVVHKSSTTVTTKKEEKMYEASKIEKKENIDSTRIDAKSKDSALLTALKANKSINSTLPDPSAKYIRPDATPSHFRPPKSSSKQSGFSRD